LDNPARLLLNASRGKADIRLSRRKGSVQTIEGYCPIDLLLQTQRSVRPNWAKSGNMGLKDLDKENARRRRAISDLTLDKLILQWAVRGNYLAPRDDAAAISGLVCKPQTG
jgi:hypothetical protein